MKKWSFVVEIDEWSKTRDLVEEKAKEVVGTIGVPDSERATYKLIVTSYQAKKRWFNDDPSIPRQDWGLDLDNILKPVFDGLGPIIGYRVDWPRNKKHPGVLDASIVEVYAKKMNSGSDKEFIGIEIELLHYQNNE